jgi:hypothetical protein
MTAELVIVIIGVFIALWVQQWNNERAEKRSAQLAADRIDQELLLNTRSVYGRLAITFCVDTRVKEIISGLEQSEHWKAMVQPVQTSDNRYPDQPPQAVRTGFQVFSTTAFEAAQSSGALDALDPNLSRLYRTLYRNLTEIRQAMNEMHEANMRLAILTEDRDLDQAQRLDFIQAARTIADRNYFAARASLSVLRSMEHLQPKGREQLYADVSDLYRFLRKGRGTCIRNNPVEIWAHPEDRWDRPQGNAADRQKDMLLPT